MLRRVDRSMRPATWIAGIVITGIGLTALVRIPAELLVSPGEDFFQPGNLVTPVFLAYQMLVILLTFSLFLMVNRRLVADLENDLTERKRVEEALRSSEEKFFKAFNSSPDAILISRLADGRLIEANEGFSRLAGYSREEALSDTALNLGLWANPRDREVVMTTLQKDKIVRDREIDFQARSGRLMTCLYSAEIISLNGEAHVLSVVRDINAQVQNERLTRLRLELWEYGATHPLEELMQKALDEICALTGSPIGFFHFVHEDQKSLSLQAWSTRTKEEFCQAEGRGFHYAIDKAGIWVEAFHKREPVIHNDYPSLPDRKGLPEGHAEVTRELVVPVLREGVVVSILGVGNKPYDYDENDVKLVSHTADIVWTIVERKLAEEQIQQLNSRLAHLAMTDELTGVLNRRSFFENGAREFKRFTRYETPLSLLVLDIDHFKHVNDMYGHDVGDRALKAFAGIIQSNIRATDILSRVGGDEFSLILPSTGLANASSTAEKLRLAVETTPCFTHKEEEHRVTISIGVVTANEKRDSFDAMVKEADIALYQAKRRGRNRVVLSNEKADRAPA